MTARYTIFKFLLATGEKIPLHQSVPEPLTGWLCKMCELEMKPADRDKGFIIVKETMRRPVHREVVTAHAS